jgi:hypothetical protein
VGCRAFALCPRSSLLAFSGSLKLERIISMLETIISDAGKIADLQNLDDLILLTDSQDVKEILSDLNFFAQEDEYLVDINGLLVAVQDGAYGEIYAYEGTVPYLTLDIWKLELVWTPIN